VYVTFSQQNCAHSWKLARRPIAGLAVSTGMRRGEILALRWLDFDRDGARLMLPQAKNGEGRVIYLNELALQVINSLPRNCARSTAKLFPDVTPEQVSVAFIRTCTDAGIDFSLHDLRHTAASWLRMSGADIHTVAQLLGHKDLRMAARYQHLSPDYMSKAGEGLGSGLYGYAHHEQGFPPWRYRSVTGSGWSETVIRINLFVLLASPTGFEPVLPP
jgi:integrase